MFGAYVKIEKAMIHAGIFNELALIFFTAHRFGKFDDMLMRDNGISLAMDQQHGAEAFSD